MGVNHGFDSQASGSGRKVGLLDVLWQDGERRYSRVFGARLRHQHFVTAVATTRVAPLRNFSSGIRSTTNAPFVPAGDSNTPSPRSACEYFTPSAFISSRT